MYNLMFIIGTIAICVAMTMLVLKITSGIDADREAEAAAAGIQCIPCVNDRRSVECLACLETLLAGAPCTPPSPAP